MLNIFIYAGGTELVTVICNKKGNVCSSEKKKNKKLVLMQLEDIMKFFLLIVYQVKTLGKKCSIGFS